MGDEECSRCAIHGQERRPPRAENGRKLFVFRFAELQLSVVVGEIDERQAGKNRRAIGLVQRDNQLGKAILLEVD